METETTEAGSLRARKKARTRHDLAVAAGRLFQSQGYEETTLDQVAAAADVSLRTLQRYFDSKVQLALAPTQAALDYFAAAVGAPDREVDALACWRSHVEETARALSSRPDLVQHLKLVYSVPVLVMGMLEIYRRYEDVLAVGLAKDAGRDPDDDLYARLFAAMLVAGNASSIRRWFIGGGETDLTPTCTAVLDFAIESFPPRDAKSAQRLANV